MTVAEKLATINLLRLYLYAKTKRKTASVIEKENGLTIFDISRRKGGNGEAVVLSGIIYNRNTGEILKVFCNNEDITNNYENVLLSES